MRLKGASGGGIGLLMVLVDVERPPVPLFPQESQSGTRCALLASARFHRLAAGGRQLEG